MSRPTLRVVRPEPARAPNAFAILGADERARLANIVALVARINRGLSGPYTTTESLEAASWQARELADEANALDRAIGRRK